MRSGKIAHTTQKQNYKIQRCVSLCCSLYRQPQMHTYARWPFGFLYLFPYNINIIIIIMETSLGNLKMRFCAVIALLIKIECNSKANYGTTGCIMWSVSKYEMKKKMEIWWKTSWRSEVVRKKWLKILFTWKKFVKSLSTPFWPSYVS